MHVRVTGEAEGREGPRRSINIALLCLTDVWHIFMFPQQIPLSYFPFCQSSSRQHILTIILEKLLIKTALFCQHAHTHTHERMLPPTHTHTCFSLSFSHASLFDFWLWILWCSSVQMQKLRLQNVVCNLRFTHVGDVCLWMRSSHYSDAAAVAAANSQLQQRRALCVVNGVCCLWAGRLQLILFWKRGGRYWWPSSPFWIWHWI